MRGSIASLKITDSESYANAAEMVKGFKAIQDKIKADFKEPKKLAHAAHAAICAQETGHLNKTEDAIKQIKTDMLAWSIAESKRIAAENLEAERIAKDKVVSEVIETADKLERMGDSAGAEAVLNEPVRYVPPPVVPSGALKIAGIKTGMTRKYEIVKESLIPREYLKPDETKIGRVVKAMGTKIEIPGVKIWEEPTMSVRGAA